MVIEALPAGVRAFSARCSGLDILDFSCAETWSKRYGGCVAAHSGHARSTVLLHQQCRKSHLPERGSTRKHRKRRAADAGHC